MLMYRYSILLFLFGAVIFNSCGQGIKIYVSPEGNDNASGLQMTLPLKTIDRALKLAEEENAKNKLANTRIILLDGHYRLEESISIDSDQNIGPLSIEAANPGSVVIKGSKLIEGTWEQYNGEIMQLKTSIEISPYAQLFVNGLEMVLARYPNYNSAISHYHGYAPDAIDPERVKQWEKPEGAILHAMHRGEWGGFHYLVEDVNKKGKVSLKGGHQNNRPSPMHQEYRMVENVFEELDAPGEWYFDPFSATLYVYPYEGMDLENSVVEISSLKKPDNNNRIKG